MSNNKSQPDHNNDNKDDFSLKKDEIISGHNVYLAILQNSISISTDFLKAFINFQDNEVTDSLKIDFTNSPLFTNNVKVGFIIAKKKIKKAVLRNRIKRLLREGYRLNKKLFKTFSYDTNIIFSLTDEGYNYFLSNKNVKYIFFDNEIKKLSDKIKKHFSNK